MVEAGVLVEDVLSHPPGFVVGLGLLLCVILLIACCAGSCQSSKEDQYEDIELSISTPRSDSGGQGSGERVETSASLSIPIPIGGDEAAGPIHTYMNMNAAGTKFEPVKFNINKVIGGLKKKLNRYNVDSKRLDLHEVIGKGAFGLVYKGTYKDDNNDSILVAVKTVHGDECSPADMKSFLEEVVRMFGFNHVNVQSMIGICFKSSQPYAVMPFMECGDLRSFVVSPEEILTLRDLIEFTLQIAKGMEYLSRCKFVHRDLAARNCMINKHHVIKVADFGLSRDIFTSDYYRMKNDNTTPLPVRWMAVESLANRVFTTKSDVWSFGIVMWELMTRGQTPYPRLPSLNAVDFVRGGGRLEKPAGCPSSVFKVMSACWHIKPDSRPSFSTLVKQIHTLLGG